MSQVDRMLSFTISKVSREDILTRNKCETSRYTIIMLCRELSQIIYSLVIGERVIMHNSGGGDRNQTTDQEALIDQNVLKHQRVVKEHIFCDFFLHSYI